MHCCGANGPGYASPRNAYLHGPREKLLYVTCARMNKSGPDVLATIDVDPESRTYAQVRYFYHYKSKKHFQYVKVIHQLPMLHINDEVHHSGWNACSSCFGDKSVSRSHLILPCLHSNRVYVIDTKTNERQPRIETV